MASVLEISDFGVIGLGGLNWRITAGLVIPQAVALTAYGLVATAHRQSCGCGGSAAKGEHVGGWRGARGLITRNAFLFGLGLAGAVAEPAAWRLRQVDAVVFEMALLPLVCLIGILSWRLLNARHLAQSVVRDEHRALLFARIAQHV